MNHAESLGAKQLFTPLRFRCQQVFFISRKFFSRPRRGNSLARRRRMSHFQTRVKNFFAIRENFLPRRPCGHGQFVGANGFMRLFDHTVKLFSAKNFAFLPAAGGLSYQHTGKTQKNVGIFFFQTPSSPHAKASCRQYQDVPAMAPAPCISARSRCKAATLPTSPLAGTSSSLTDCPASPQTPLSQPMQYRPSGRCISPDGTHPHGPVPGHEKSRERSPLPGLS